MQITYLETNNYSKNPIVQEMLSKTKSYRILTMKDFADIIPYLKHTKWALENGKYNFAMDQLRLWLATQEDLCYRDLDSNWTIDDIKPNAICLENDGNLNDGSFLITKKGCKWAQFYCDLYNKIPESDYSLVNYDIHKKYPAPKEDFDIKLVRPKAGWHAYLSWFNRISKKLTSPTLCYTFFRDRAQQEIMKGHNVLWFGPTAGDTYFSKYNAFLWQYIFCPIDLFNAQLDYSCGRHIQLINIDNTL